MLKTIAVLTSGGDSPGMNVAIRTAVRLAKAQGKKIFGVSRGYQGLIEGDITELESGSVSNILQRGGTILQTSRSEEFRTEEGRQKALQHLIRNNIEGLIVIGGNGSFKGALALSEIWKGLIVGVPGTIDNDIFGTDFTIGFDTAVNTALDAIDKIRDTAESHNRTFLVEVMGRRAGFIALEVGVAGGAKFIVLPEYPLDLQRMSNRITEEKKKGALSSIVIVAEESYEGTIYQLAKKLEELNGGEYRVIVLGHLQRGGTPSARDRILAFKLGASAVQVLDQGKSPVMVGEIEGKLAVTHLEEASTRQKELDPFLVALTKSFYF